ncbi:TadE/TadG family type IV pilus assembly protein [Streptomyces sp. NPDC055078]
MSTRTDTDTDAGTGTDAGARVRAGAGSRRARPCEDRRAGGRTSGRAAVRTPGAVARRRPRALDDRGQAAIEFTGTVPVILATLVLLWQAALTGYTFSLAGHAADRGARAGAVGGDGACQAAALEDLPAAWQGGSFGCGRDGDLYEAEVSVPVPVLFPGVSFSLTVDGRAAVPVEDKSTGGPE